MKVTAHSPEGTVGWTCKCGKSFPDYRAFSDHFLESMDCPRCGSKPVDLQNAEFFSWVCGHRIAR